MKFGSLQNYLYSGTIPDEPQIGMGVTEIMWTDREPYTIIDMNDKKTVLTIQADEAIRTDSNGMSDAQEYRFEPDPNGTTRKISLRKDGKWYDVGSKMGQGSVYLIGIRQKYYDYSF